MAFARVAEVAREHGWHPPKSLDSDENFKPEHTLFCRKLRFVAIYALFFGDLWANKCLFAMKGGSRVPHTYFEKYFFLKTIKNHSLTVKTCFALSLGFILCIYSS